MDTPDMTLGIIGSVTGATALIVQVCQWLADRSRIRVMGSLTITKTEKFPAGALRLSISIMNRGKRPIRISDAGIFIGSRSATVNGQPASVKGVRLGFPHFKLDAMPRLEEGDRKDLEVYPFNPAHVVANPRRKMTLFVIDSLDREYRCKIEIPSADSILQLREREASGRSIASGRVVAPSARPMNPGTH